MLGDFSSSMAARVRWQGVTGLLGALRSLLALIICLRRCAPARQADPATDEQRMKTTMMSKKAKRLYESIQMGKARKSAHLEKLKAKREALEAKRQKTTKL